MKARSSISEKMEDDDERIYQPAKQKNSNNYNEAYKKPNFRQGRLPADNEYDQ